MTRTMYDSIHPEHWPNNGDLYAGYVGGSWPTYTNGSAEAHANGKFVVSIAVASVFDAIVLDVENGDATPELAPKWVSRQRARGQEPTVYCEKFAFGSVRNQFVIQHVPEPWYWIAAYSDPAGSVFHLSPRIVAHQYGGDSAAGYDVSIVQDYWQGVDMFTPEQEAQILDAVTKINQIHDAIYKGHPEFGQPGMEGTTAETWRKVLGK